MRKQNSLSILAALVFAIICLPVFAADDDTVAATKTRKLLKTKISVDWKEVSLQDILDEIKDEVKGLKFLIDGKGGVSRNQKLTYKGKDKTVEEILDGLLTKPELGYVIISKKADAYDGLVQIRKGSERGKPKK